MNQSTALDKISVPNQNGDTTAKNEHKRQFPNDITEEDKFIYLNIQYITDVTYLLLLSTIEPSEIQDLWDGISLLNTVIQGKPNNNFIRVYRKYIAAAFNIRRDECNSWYGNIREGSYDRGCVYDNASDILSLAEKVTGIINNEHMRTCCKISNEQAMELKQKIEEIVEKVVVEELDKKKNSMIKPTIAAKIKYRYKYEKALLKLRTHSQKLSRSKIIFNMMGRVISEWIRKMLPMTTYEKKIKQKAQEIQESRAKKIKIFLDEKEEKLISRGTGISQYQKSQDQWLNNTKWLLNGAADTNYCSVISDILDSPAPLETMKDNLNDFIKNIGGIEKDLLKKLLKENDDLKIEIKRDQRSILMQLLDQKQKIASTAKRYYAKKNCINGINIDKELITPINKEYGVANKEVFLKDKQEELDSILKQLSKDFEELNAKFKNNAGISSCMQNQMKLIKESKDELKERIELKSYKCLLNSDASKIPKKGEILFFVSGDNVSVKIQEHEKGLTEFIISKDESICDIIIAASKRTRMEFTPEDEKLLLQSTLFSKYIYLKEMIENNEDLVNMTFPEINHLINSAKTCISNIKKCREELLLQAGLKGNTVFHGLNGRVSDQTLAQAAHEHGVQCS